MLLDLDEGTLSTEKVGGGILDFYCWVGSKDLNHSLLYYLHTSTITIDQRDYTPS